MKTTTIALCAGFTLMLLSISPGGSPVALAAADDPTDRIKTEAVGYKHGDVQLEGYLAYDPAGKGKRPGVLVVHEWYGLNDFAKAKATELAALGYVALAVDMYGKGVLAKDREKASELATPFRKDRKLMRERIKAALDVLAKNEMVDPKKIASIGFCFGGTTSLELARSGADVAGVVSFHGSLDTPEPGDAKNIKAKVLVLHGAEDPGVPKAQVEALMDEMRKGKVNWQMNFYSDAVHSFTNPAAGNDPSKGNAYHEQTAKRAWREMKGFLEEVFAGGK